MRTGLPPGGRAAFWALVLLVILSSAGAWVRVSQLDRPSARPRASTGFFRTLAGADSFRDDGLFDRTTIDGAGAVVLDPSAGLHQGTSPPAGYTGGAFFFGVYVSPAWAAAGGLDSVVPSWSADTPEGTWLKVEARAFQGGSWTRYYTMAVWASSTSDITRQNGGRQEDARGRVDTDDLILRRPATAVQVRVTLFTRDPDTTPRLRRLSVVAGGPESEPAGSPESGARGVDLNLPERRQNDYPDGGGWCSPTSVSMVLAYWAAKTGNPGWDRSVPEVAAGVRDYEYGGTGNWVFNTAYAAGLGLDAFVTRLDSLARLEPWIVAGIPVIINIEFERGELAGAPMPRSDGHIIVVRGFDPDGRPIVNDPASRADQGETVRIVFDREELERAWLGRSRGTAYIIFPPGYIMLPSEHFAEGQVSQP